MTLRRRGEGDVLKITLDNRRSALAVVLKEPLVAFFCTSNIAELHSQKPIFIIWVMNNALNSKDWKKVGNIEIGSNIDQAPAFFKRDPINGEFSKYFIGGKEVLSSKDECKFLECAAAWEKDHIEDRLRDYFDEKPNIWVESMKT